MNCQYSRGQNGRGRAAAVDPVLGNPRDDVGMVSRDWLFSMSLWRASREPLLDRVRVFLKRIVQVVEVLFLLGLPDKLIEPGALCLTPSP
jgi:hypothetical protein